MAKSRKTKTQQIRRLERKAPSRLELIAEATVEVQAAGAEPATPRVDIVAYHGGELQLKNFPHPVVVDLATARFEAESIRLLNQHDNRDAVGHTDYQEITAGEIRLGGVLSVPGPSRDRIVEASRNGFPWQASIGARGFTTKFTPKGQVLRANGKTFAGPVFLAQGAVIYETSIVVIGADYQSRVRVAAEASSEGVPDMTWEQFLDSLGLVEAELSDTQRELLQASYDAKFGESDDDPPAPPTQPTQPTRQAAPAPAGDGVATLRASAAEETRRIAAVSQALKGHDELIAEAIEDGWTAEQAQLKAQALELEALRASRPQGGGNGGPAIHAGGFEANSQVIEAALSINTGMPSADAERLFSAETLEAASDRRVRNITLHGLCRLICAEAGVSIPYGAAGMEVVERGVEAHRKLEAAGFSTVSIPGILSNVANKRMTAAYTRSPSMVPFAFTRVAPTDFKPLYTYRLEGEGQLQQLPPDGEITHGKLVENEYTIQLKTYARMLALTRTMMINDDLGALAKIAEILGVMAYKSREQQAAELILNPPTVGGTAFFHTSHKNLLTGAGSALSVDALTAAVTLAEQQVDSEGYPISVSFDRLLVCPANKVVAQQLVSDTEIRITGSTDAKVTVGNPHAGNFERLSSAWLSNSKVTGADTTGKKWWLLPSPDSDGAFQVAYLNGNDMPTIDSSETAFNTLGMQWRCVFDFGFGVGDYRLAQQNNGA